MKGLDYTEKMWTSYMVNHLTASSRSRDVLRERDIAGTMESGEGGEERKEGRKEWFAGFLASCIASQPRARALICGVLGTDH